MNDESDVYTYTAAEENSGIRLDVFLARQSELSRSKIGRLIADGHVVIDGSRTAKASYPMEPGDVATLTVPPREEPDFAPENIPLDIVYIDEHIIVINKPAGMVVHPGRGNVTGTLASALLYHVRSVAGVGDAQRPGIVHRLDKDTSGLIVAALTEKAHTNLSRMIRNREVGRGYIAFVWGHPRQSAGSIEAPLGRHPKKGTMRAVVEDGKVAVTHYELIERNDFLSSLRIKLETGRTHQIRVHLAHIGHHIFGDPMYGGREERLKGFTPEIRTRAKKLLKILDRQALHAYCLELLHPVSGQDLRFETPFPADLMALERVLK